MYPAPDPVALKSRLYQLLEREVRLLQTISGLVAGQQEFERQKAASELYGLLRRERQRLSRLL